MTQYTAVCKSHIVQMLLSVSFS